MSSSSTKSPPSLKTLTTQVTSDDKLRNVWTRWKYLRILMNVFWVTDKLTGPDRSKQKDSWWHIINKTWCESRRRSEQEGESHQGRYWRWLKLNLYFKINPSVLETDVLRADNAETRNNEQTNKSSTHNASLVLQSLHKKPPPLSCKFTTSDCTSRFDPAACSIRHTSVRRLDPWCAVSTERVRWIKLTASSKQN